MIWVQQSVYKLTYKNDASTEFWVQYIAQIALLLLQLYRIKNTFGYTCSHCKFKVVKSIVTTNRIFGAENLYIEIEWDHTLFRGVRSFCYAEGACTHTHTHSHKLTFFIENLENSWLCCRWHILRSCQRCMQEMFLYAQCTMHIAHTHLHVNAFLCWKQWNVGFVTMPIGCHFCAMQSNENDKKTRRIGNSTKFQYDFSWFLLPFFWFYTFLSKHLGIR